MLNPFRTIGRLNGKPVRAGFHPRFWLICKLAGKRLVVLNAKLNTAKAAVEPMNPSAGAFIASTTHEGGEKLGVHFPGS